MVVALAAIWSAIGPAKSTSFTTVGSIIDLTRTTTATYAVYSTSKIYDPDTPEEQTAEFHKGHLHRVETPRDRVVANCMTGEGYHLRLVEGTIRSDPSVALSACGIDANRILLSEQITGVKSGRFGKIRRLIVTDKFYVRGYDVTESGVIVGAFIRENTPNKKLLLQQTAYKLTADLPDNSMFSEQSLSRRFLPE